MTRVRVLVSVLLLFLAFGTASLLHLLGVLPFLSFPSFRSSFLHAASLSCLAFSSSLLRKVWPRLSYSPRLASFLRQPHPLVMLMPLNPKATFPQLVPSFTTPIFTAACFQERNSVAAVELPCPVQIVIYLMDYFFIFCCAVLFAGKMKEQEVVL